VDNPTLKQRYSRDCARCRLYRDSSDVFDKLRRVTTEFRKKELFAYLPGNSGLVGLAKSRG
jgi:hypothetical protein